MMNNQQIIEEIKKLCFSKGASVGADPHSESIIRLEYFLRKNNYRTENEHELYYNHLTLKTGRVRRAFGMIDLFAERAKGFFGEDTGHTMAIEYDSMRSLKYKSIEKLLQSNADTLIGIVGNGTLNYNRERILEVMDGSGITDRKVLLIAVSENKSEEVSWKSY